VTGRDITGHLIAGERDPKALAQLARARARRKITELEQALEGAEFFTPAHAALLKAMLDRINVINAEISRLSRVIEDLLAPYEEQLQQAESMPGWGRRSAQDALAETGADMTRFPTAKHLASWAGTTPGNNESAGKVKSSRTRPGNPYLQGALGAAAMSCSQNPRTYLGARYRRIATRRGPQKANVAIQHSMLTAIWHMGTTGTLYNDPGGDYFTRLHPDRAKNRAIHQLETMGYHVTLNHAG
jgi:transposase